MTTVSRNETGYDHETPYDDTVLRRFVFNQGALTAAVARRLGGRVGHTVDQFLADAGSVVPYYNQSVLSRPVLDAQDQALDDAESFFASSRRDVTLLSVWPTPDLTPRGWRLVGHPVLVAHSRGLAQQEPRAGVTVRVATDLDDALRAEELAAVGYPLDRQDATAGDVLPTEVPGLVTHVGSVDGEDVSVASSFVSHGMVNLCLAATLPEGRRRGVWDALVRARCAQAPDLPSVAYTSDDSRPGFVRMGFLPVTRCTLWLRPGRS